MKKMDMQMAGKRGRLETEAGFTLIETMVVVGILGLLVGVAIPNFLDWNRHYKLKEAVGALHSSINLARMTAVNQNTTITVTVCYQQATCPTAIAGPPAVAGYANPTPSQVTVLFRNPTGGDVMPLLTLDSEVSLTDATNGTVTAPQDTQFNPLGMRQFTGGNANNKCITAAGVTTACAGGNAQAYNFKNSHGLNYRIVIGQSGKSVWCYAPDCIGN